MTTRRSCCSPEGRNSTTCLAWALDRFASVETIGFDYGQRHRVELDARLSVLGALRKTFPAWGARLADDHPIDLAVLGRISETSLTTDMDVAMQANGLPNTFVPGRNLVFLAFAAAVAYRRGAKHLIAGVCETDYSGYPDCRDDTIKAMQLAVNLGMDARFVIHTPLMWIDKAQTWALAEKLGGRALIELVRRETHTCYQGERQRLHPWGYGCGACPACELRAQGWERYCATGATTKELLMQPDLDRLRRREGAVLFLAFAACVPLANWLIGHVGTVCAPNGPCLIPVAPHLYAPSGVLVAGLALVLRDLVQRRLGLAWSAFAIVVGAALSALFAPPALVVASTVAFGLSEAADLVVYTPLQRKGLIVAAFASSFVGLIVDSVVFLGLAFGSLDFVGGQVLGKFWMVLMMLPVLQWVRSRDHRLGLKPA